MIKILNDNIKRIETFNLNNHELPFVISIPHSGIYISERMKSKLLDNVIFASMDWYLPKLYCFLNELGFTTIINNVSRYEIDVNRDMENKGVGESFLKNYIYTNTTFGDKMYKEELTLEDIEYRINEFYTPYHQTVNNAIQEKLKHFNKVYLIDLHSFSKFLDADAILGNDNGNTTSDNFIQLVERLLNKEGYKVKKNKPYCGGYITKHYGNDIENCEALQIELWYGSYIGNVGVKNEQFPHIDEEIFKEAQEKIKNFFINLKNNINLKRRIKMIEQLNLVDDDLRKYIEESVLPQYNRNEQAHGIEHINYVIKRSFDLIKQNNLEVDNNMVYVVAAYHDIGHYIDPKKHELLSAQIMSEDEKLKQFFKEEELLIIKQAIEDHRASSDHEPRSIYGKIVSSADRNNTVEQCLERSYYYGKRLNPELTDRQLYERAFEHLNLKFGMGGYAKFFLKDKVYENFLENIRKILKNKEEFCKIQEEYIKKLEGKGE